MQPHSRPGRNSEASGNSASGRRPGHGAERAARLRSSPAAPGAWTKKICFEPTISHPAERCPQSGLRTLERNLALLIPSPDPVAQSSGHVLRADASCKVHIYLVDRRRESLHQRRQRLQEEFALPAPPRLFPTGQSRPCKGVWRTSRALAPEYASHGIRINAAGPGAVVTPIRRA